MIYYISVEIQQHGKILQKNMLIFSVQNATREKHLNFLSASGQNCNVFNSLHLKLENKYVNMFY